MVSLRFIPIDKCCQNINIGTISIYAIHRRLLLWVVMFKLGFLYWVSLYDRIFRDLSTRLLHTVAAGIIDCNPCCADISLTIICFIWWNVLYNMMDYYFSVAWLNSRIVLCQCSLLSRFWSTKIKINMRC